MKGSLWTIVASIAIVACSSPPAPQQAEEPEPEPIANTADPDTPDESDPPEVTGPRGDIVAACNNLLAMNARACNWSWVTDQASCVESISADRDARDRDSKEARLDLIWVGCISRADSCYDLTACDDAFNEGI